MMWPIFTGAGFVAGAVAGRASLGSGARRLVKTVIKGGITAGQAIQVAAVTAREELADIAAEAKADHDAKASSAGS